jgi:cyclopropane-fatty-acyl-phospholipid synthase
VNSLLYDAWVLHRREYPAENEFRYHVPVFIFDLAELESGEVDSAWFRRRLVKGSQSKRGAVLPRLLSLREWDYLYPGPGGLRQKLARALGAGGLDPELAKGHVRLVTSARFLGYAFNPVNFWLIYEDIDTPDLAAAVAEVNNTFGEKHIYVLGGDEPISFPVRFSVHKEFHVSPFNDMEGDYNFSFGDAREGMDISIDLVREGHTLMHARLWSDEAGKPMKASALTGLLLHPQRALTYPRIVRQAASIYLRRRLPVHTKPQPASPMTIRRNPPQKSLLDRMAQGMVLRKLSAFKRGSLSLKLPEGRTINLGGQEPGPKASIEVIDPAFFRSLLIRGATGLGEAYMDGLWHTDDLFKVFGYFLCNENRLKGRERPNHLANLIQRLLSRGYARPPANTRTGSKANISAHYDLSNQAFALFLDPGMSYSCAVFADPENPQEPLEEAQNRKLRLMAQKAGIKPGDHVLEIGCGWGSFAVLAVKEFGCKVTALTLSQEQFDYVQELIGRLGLEDKIEVLLEDYRDHKGQYDAVVSIEMIEAVGHRYHKAYFQAIDHLLAPGGKAVIQAITIVDQRYDAYRHIPDWISTYIFPGGLLLSLRRIADVVGNKTSLVISGVEDIGKHYAPTLAAWRARFLENWEAIKELGFDDRFKRTFEYYFTICEAGFRYRHIRNVQFVLDRPRYHAPCQEDF